MSPKWSRKQILNISQFKFYIVRSAVVHFEWVTGEWAEKNASYMKIMNKITIVKCSLVAASPPYLDRIDYNACTKCWENGIWVVPTHFNQTDDWGLIHNYKYVWLYFLVGLAWQRYSFPTIANANMIYLFTHTHTVK